MFMVPYACNTVRTISDRNIVQCCGGKGPTDTELCVTSFSTVPSMRLKHRFHCQCTVRNQNRHENRDETREMVFRKWRNDKWRNDVKNFFDETNFNETKSLKSMTKRTKTMGFHPKINFPCTPPFGFFFGTPNSDDEMNDYEQAMDIQMTKRTITI